MPPRSCIRDIDSRSAGGLLLQCRQPGRLLVQAPPGCVVFGPARPRAGDGSGRPVLDVYRRRERDASLPDGGPLPAVRTGATVDKRCDRDI